jgi:hypothetical protein
MFSNSTRILIVIAAFAYGVFQSVNGNRSGYLAIAAAVVLMIGYFRYGPIRPAFSALHQGEFDTARQLVTSIRFPNLLSSQSLAYFHWINGVLAYNGSDYTSAETQMRCAIEGNLRTTNDRCIATATLAQIVAKNGQLNEATKILNDAMLIPHKEEVGEFLTNASDEINNAG